MQNIPHHRTRLSLDGSWQFWLDPGSNLTPESLLESQANTIHVPAPWQAQSPAWRDYAGTAWYQRKLELPAEWMPGSDDTLLLGIDAADDETQAWLNGIQVGSHTGGYLPFQFDISAAALPGSNTVTIRVDDSPARFSETPHGKQGWYGPLSGLWQPVWVERRPAVYIHSLSIHSDPVHRCIEAQAQFSHPAPDTGQLVTRLLGPDGRLAARVEQSIARGAHGAILNLEVEKPILWSPQSPNLYTLEVELTIGRAIDVEAKTFGFRTIEAHDGRLFLNGEPLYLRAALDQDYYPGTIAIPPSLDFLEDQLRKAKELGLNCLRCHIKVADPRYYEVADRMGMLVWTELPNWSTFTDLSDQNGRLTLEGILQRDGHHPSIIIWTILNEDWGMDLVNDPAHRAWLKNMYGWLKDLDPSRLVVDNSACQPNYHLKTDIEDYHFYRHIPDHRREWDAFVATFAARSSFTFSPHGDAERTGKEPLILSEFGNWGLPDIDLLAYDNGKEPWWLDTGLEWGEGVVYPHGVKDRFRRLGLQGVFGSWSAFVEATQRQQHLALKYQIEAIRRYPQINGYVITEMTDVHWEANGLLDLDRNPKLFHSDLIQVNSNTVIVPAWERVAYYGGETVRIGLSVAHAAGEPIREAVLHWKLGDGRLSGCIPVAAIQPGQVCVVPEIQITLPALSTPSTPSVQRLALELRSWTGGLLAQNYLDLSLYPPRPAPDGLPALYTPQRDLAESLADLGYRVTGDHREAGVQIVQSVTPEVVADLHEGGRLLVLAGSPAAAPGALLAKVRLLPRKGSPWEGDWASSFTWLKRQGAFAHLPGGPLTDHSFDRITPDYVLAGFGEWDYQASVHAGLVVGWVHRPAVLIGERRYGKGKAVLNTFRLEPDSLGCDPTAAALLDGLINLAAAPF